MLLIDEEEARELLKGIQRALMGTSLVVKYADKTITYRDRSDLLQAEYYALTKLGLNKQQQSGVPNQVRPVNDDGW